MNAPPVTSATVLTPPPTPAPPAATPAPARRPLLGYVSQVGSLVGTVAVLAAGALLFRHLQAKPPAETPVAASTTGAKAPRVERVSADTLSVPAEVAKSLGVRTQEAKAADRPRPLPAFQGSLAIDSNRLARIHSRLAGEVVALGTPEGGESERPTGGAGPRSLRAGDAVAAGQLLAVLWSKELGEKKSELVDTTLKLKLDRENLERFRSLTGGVIAERQIREAEATVRADENAVARVEATLRALRLSDDEIKAIGLGAEKVGSPEERRELSAGRTWARVEVRSPFAGVVLEKNTNVGDVTDTVADLFKVADLSRLTVWVNVYEDDLPALQALPKPIRWEVRLSNQSGAVYPGQLEQIGALLDPNQHTVPANGTVENAKGELRAGQFATAVVVVPPVPGEVEVPTAGLVEDGKDSVVFVQPDPAANLYTRRMVTVTRRFHDVAYVSSGVKPGERVVVGAAIQLKQALDDAPDYVAK